MELKTWSPFFDLDKGWRLFDIPQVSRDITGLDFRPSIDVDREGGELVVIADLPGVDGDDIDVAIDGGILTIRGEKTDEKEISEDDRYVRERSYGKFHRHITLPDGVDPDEMKATYEKGVLTVRVPLPVERTQEPRHIPVEVSAST